MIVCEVFKGYVKVMWLKCVKRFLLIIVWCCDEFVLVDVI